MAKKNEDKYQQLAFDIISDGDVVDKLRFWWCNYYKRPFLDPLFEEYTVEQLLIEFHAVKLLNNQALYQQMKKIQSAKAKGRELDLDLDDEDWFKKEMGDDYYDPDETDEDKDLKENDENDNIAEEEMEDIDIRF